MSGAGTLGLVLKYDYMEAVGTDLWYHKITYPLTDIPGLVPPRNYYAYCILRGTTGNLEFFTHAQDKCPYPDIVGSTGPALTLKMDWAVCPK